MDRLANNQIIMGEWAVRYGEFLKRNRSIKKLRFYTLLLGLGLLAAQFIHSYFADPYSFFPVPNWVMGIMFLTTYISHFTISYRANKVHCPNCNHSPGRWLGVIAQDGNPVTCFHCGAQLRKENA